MPEIYNRELARLARAMETPIAVPLTEIVLDLEQLEGEALAGGETEVAAAIGRAITVGRSRLATASMPADNAAIAP